MGLGLLDGGEFLLETVEESGFFGDLIAGLFDQFSRGFIDVVGVHHASVQGIELATNGEDTLFEAGLVFIDHIGRNIEIEFVTD